MHDHGLADDKAITDEFADGLARVGVRDLAELVGVEPNLALAAANNGGGKTLLGAKVDPIHSRKKIARSVKNEVKPEPRPSFRRIFNNAITKSIQNSSRKITIPP